MTDHPLDLRPHEVRAALDGRLSLIVRPLENVPPAPEPDCHPKHVQKHEAPYLDAYCSQHRTDTNPRGMSRFWNWWQVDDRMCWPQFEVQFAPGDRLWCRETWRIGAWHYNNATVALDYVDGPRKEWLDVDDIDQLHRLIDESREDARKANVRLSDLTYYEYTWPPGHSPTRWRPSITMPRWASRLTLTVSDVDVKRVQEISPKEARSTGVDPVHMAPGGPYGNPSDGWLDYREGFKRQHQDAWDRNPWCAFYSVTVQEGGEVSA
ncbi:hypothetical protein GTA62_14875 [Roseobacter sp. HKCCD9010]|uniref:hypothetical protein n=1 Tax=unclassified Roseobacter TaxID=196798 RepID=UPI00149207C1|nr:MULTISPECIES: hypothetical protein [unclassified Roseobacter]MBF9050604.1 hypothetical protein [Rhodobacterales bacterium HKCCD4356]NNV11977.1 hypothetical protein [Roseobacter sp. HKCCD7357]NNV16990.1 hypothetical protein [Roseobacter sp. HKCCD8768]NNV26220.1 hypothetical protein [Roseobacter sp. HKCCD8192]NNV30715.1 hypothetical protein [Roseobacter sp. HKCCD9061]